MKRRCTRSPHSTIETRSRGGRAGNRDPSHRSLEDASAAPPGAVAPTPRRGAAPARYPLHPIARAPPAEGTRGSSSTRAAPASRGITLLAGSPLPRRAVHRRVDLEKEKEETEKKRSHGVCSAAELAALAPMASTSARDDGRARAANRPAPPRPRTAHCCCRARPHRSPMDRFEHEGE